MKYIFILLTIIALAGCGSSGGGGSNSGSPNPPVVTEPIPLAGWVGNYTGSTINILEASSLLVATTATIYHANGVYSVGVNNGYGAITLGPAADSVGEWIGHSLYRNVPGNYSEYFRARVRGNALGGLTVIIQIVYGPSYTPPVEMTTHPIDRSRFIADLKIITNG